jgi:hypothetical protein
MHLAAQLVAADTSTTAITARRVTSNLRSDNPKLGRRVWIAGQQLLCFGHHATREYRAESRERLRGVASFQSGRQHLTVKERATPTFS